MLALAIYLGFGLVLFPLGSLSRVTASAIASACALPSSTPGTMTVRRALGDIFSGLLNGSFYFLILLITSRTFSVNRTILEAITIGVLILNQDTLFFSYPLVRYGAALAAMLVLCTAFL